MSIPSRHMTIAELLLWSSFLFFYQHTHCSPLSSIPTVEVSYEDLQALNMTCHSLDNCRERGEDETLQKQNCLCGRSCSKFDSCCVDSAFRNTASAMRIPNMKCLKVYGKREESIFMVDSCRPGWEGDDEIRRLCLTNPEVESDPFLAVPVTSKDTDVTYKNHFCYLCNEDTDCEMATFWNVVVRRSNRVISEKLLPKISYDQRMRSWTVQNGSNVVKVTFSVSATDSIKMNVFSCRTDLITECDNSWTDNVIREKCSAYTAIVLAENENHEIIKYKNPHCAICNNEDVSGLFCSDAPKRRSDFTTGSFATFSLTGHSICGSNMVYDDFLKRCRPAKCNSESSVAVTLSELESLEARCPNHECASRQLQEDGLKFHTCLCGPTCVNLDACCPDSPFKMNVSLGRSEIECISAYGSSNYFYMKHTCKSTFQGEALIKELCSGDPEAGNDPALSIPVTSLTTNTTYRNYYCFVCNEGEAQPPVFWNVMLIRKDEEIPFQSLEAINFDPDLGSWTIAGGSEPISLTSSIPEAIKQLVQSCQNRVVSECHASWRDDITRRKCREYMYLTPFTRKGTLYRNPHCGFCNYEDLTESYCLHGSVERRPGGEDVSSNLFVRLLNVGSGRDSQCDAGMVYDSRADKCRTPRCISRRYTLVNGQCTRRN